MCENGFPNSQFKFVKKVRNDKPIKIKTMIGELFRKGILKQGSTKSTTKN